MSLTVRFVPHSVNLGAASQWINQIEQTSPNHAVTSFEESSGSAIDREFVATKSIKPVLPFTTTDLTVLGTVGFSGYYFAGTVSNFVVYGRQLPLGGVPAPLASSDHMKMTVSDGLLIPKSIHAGHDTIAKLALECHGILGASGVQATPFVWTSDQAIATGAGQIANLYVSGPVKWTVSGGSSQLLQGISSSGVDFGIQEFKDATDGEVYDTHISIVSRMPKIEFTTKDAEQITAIGDGISVSAFAMYFRNVLANGQRTPVATADHVSISATAGQIIPSTVKLAHKEAGDASFVFLPALPSVTGALISISTGTTIPTS
jgi:hypothetical protein